MGELDFSIEKELVENPSARVAICLVLDTSGSMIGHPIDALNDGVKQFFEEINNDKVAKSSAEIAVITFGETVEILLEFGNIEKQNVPILSSKGSTPMGEAVNAALDLLEERKNLYKKTGINYYQPWMVLMTDGNPTDKIETAVERTCKLVTTKRLSIFPIGIGDQANMEVLDRFGCGVRKARRLRGLRFGEFFVWLSQSVSRVSRSKITEDVELDVDGLKGWSTL